ncbi:MAG: hypothetical protein WC455_04185 [Dehalococcoidia bacterium]|jgi:hypothetical protein
MTKSKLPIKTKIAIWWIFVLGVLVFIIPLFALGYTNEEMILTPLLLLQNLCIAFLYSLSGIFLIIRKTWAWNVAIAILTIEVFSLFIYLHVEINLDMFGGPILFAANILLLIPLILIILDRKNYLEMVRQQELEKHKDD